MKVVVIENISSYKEYLKLKIRDYDKNIDIVGDAENVIDGIKLINEKKPDIIFLDLRLAQSTGLEILKACAGKYKYVVFVTSHKNYALQGYNYNVLDYIVKPYNPNQISNALAKYRAIDNTAKDGNNRLELSIQQPISPEYIKIYIFDGELIQAVLPNDILFISSKGSNSVFHLANDKIITISKKLSEAKSMVRTFSYFSRIHRDFIINKNYITSIQKGLKSYVCLNDQHKIPLSNKYKANFFNEIDI